MRSSGQQLAMSELRDEQCKVDVCHDVCHRYNLRAFCEGARGKGEERSCEVMHAARRAGRGVSAGKGGRQRRGAIPLTHFRVCAGDEHGYGEWRGSH